MGCHTWAYRMIKPNEKKAVRNDIENMLKNDFRYVPDNSTEEERINSLMKTYDDAYGDSELNESDPTKEDIVNMVQEGNKKIHEYLKIVHDCDIKTLNEIFGYVGNGVKYKFLNNHIYIECGFDVPIRIYGYPEDKFTDAEKFINWIKEKEAEYGEPISEIYVKDGYYDEEKRKQGFSDIMADRIREFWKHYNNKVLVEFG